MFGPWIRLSLDTTMLAVEAQTVIGLRLMMLGSGGPPHGLKLIGN
jgi:hypothetical protein